MPSFSVNTNSYTYYLLGTNDSTIKYELQTLSLWKLVLNLLKIIVILLFFLASLYTLMYISFHFMYNQNPHWYDNDNITYVHDMVEYVYFSIFYMIMIMAISGAITKTNLLYMLRLRQCKTWLLVITWFCISMTIYIVFLYSFRIKLKGIYLFGESYNLCKIVKCENLSLFIYFHYSLWPSLIPLILYLMFSLCFKIFNKNLDDPQIEDDGHLIFEFEVELQSNTSNIKESLIEQNESENKQQKTSKTKIILYCMVFYVILMLSKMILFSMTELQHEIEKKFVYVYWSFTLYQMILKRILKHCAKKIDQFRMNDNENDNFLCLEYLMEIYASIYYYDWVKLYVAFHTPPANLLVFTFISHFLTEFIETNAKFTQFYYNKSKIYFGFNDDKSTLNEWRTRLTMDIFVRFMCSSMLTIAYIIKFWSLGPNGLESYFGVTYQVSMRLTIIYFAIDFVHYVFTAIFSHYVFEFNMVYQIVYYVKSHYFTISSVISIIILYFACLILLHS